MRVVRGRADGSPSEQRSSTFTGVVWSDPVLPTTDGVTVNDVFFCPEARTFWHFHERGQILRVTSGIGLVCSQGGTPQLVRAGDTVWTPPAERHWHGGSIDCCMHHTAISLGTTSWLDPVTDEEYRAAVGRHDAQTTMSLRQKAAT